MKGVIPKAEQKQILCPNCKKPIKKGQGHFMPPSFGDSGYFVCDKAGEIDLMDALKKSLKER